MQPSDLHKSTTTTQQQQALFVPAAAATAGGSATSRVLGPLEVSRASLHRFFLKGLNSTSSEGVVAILQSLQNELNLLQTLMTNYKFRFKTLRANLCYMEKALDNKVTQNGDNSAVENTGNNVKEFIPPSTTDVVRSLENVAKHSRALRDLHSTTNAPGLHKDVVILIQQLPQQIHNFRRLCEVENQKNDLLLRQRPQLLKRLRKARKRPPTPSTPHERQLPRAKQSLDVARSQESINVDGLLETFCNDGKLRIPRGRVSTVLVICRGIQASQKTPLHVDLTGVDWISPFVWNDLGVTLAAKATIKELTIPSLPPACLLSFGKSFEKGQLKRLEIKQRDRVENKTNASRKEFPYNGKQVETAFASLGKIATKSFGFFVYDALYDCASVLRGLSRGFDALSHRPYLFFALSMNSRMDRPRADFSLLNLEIITDLFLEVDELNDDGYLNLCRIFCCPSLQRLQICDATWCRIKKGQTAQTLQFALRHCSLDLLVLGDMKASQDTSGSEFLDVLFSSLSRQCRITKLIWTVVPEFRSWAIERQEAFAKQLPSMRGLDSIVMDCLPTTSSRIARVSQGKVFWYDNATSLAQS